jgi:hypothetical protein
LGSVFGDLRKAPSDEDWGAVLFDWAVPPESRLREAFLKRCAEIGERGELLRLWLCIGSRIASDIYFQVFERWAKVSLEGFWVREWADQGTRPPGVQSPFLALNPWIHLVRRPPGLGVQRRFRLSGKLKVLIIASNPPLSSTGWPHIQHLDKGENGDGMFLRVRRPFSTHRGTRWVYSLHNPTKVDVARFIREYKPDIVIYLGHGYAKYLEHESLLGKFFSAGLVLPVKGGGEDFAEVSGIRIFPDRESELEMALAGKWQALENPGAPDEGLPVEERPRLFVAFACEAAPAAPALLHCGIPAVLAMRRRIPDCWATQEMVHYCVDALTDESKSLEEAVADLRQFLKHTEPQFSDERLNFSVPVLHLGTNGGIS